MPEAADTPTLASPGPGDWRRHDADLARAAAAVLIANSHLEAFYPRAWMAGDGLVGNALFFFLSGLRVSLATSTRRENFGRWMLRRIARLYPSVIVAGLLIQIGLAHDRGWTPAKVVAAFLFPTTYGYVGHILLVYAGLYWLLRRRSRWPLAATITVALGISATAAVPLIARMPPGQRLSLGETGPVLFPAYFTAVALAGARFGPTTSRPRRRWVDAIGLAGLFAVYVGLKFEMVGGHAARRFPLLLVIVAVLCPLAIRASADDGVQAWLRRVRPADRVVSLLAAITLEMYVVQFWSHQWPAVQRLRFPLNLVAFWVVTIAGALALRAVTMAVMRAVVRLPSVTNRPS